LDRTSEERRERGAERKEKDRKPGAGIGGEE